jgi:hypothetical protein
MAKYSAQLAALAGTFAEEQTDTEAGAKKRVGRPSTATAKFCYNHRLDVFVLPGGRQVRPEAFGLSPRIKNQ